MKVRVTKKCLNCVFFIKPFLETSHYQTRYGFTCKKHGVQITQIGGDYCTPINCIDFKIK
jgi:hypothetical protein